LVFTLVLAGLGPSARAETLEGAQGIVASLDAASGRYEVRSSTLNGVFAGRLGGIPSQVSVRGGSDSGGTFRELTFDWNEQVSLTGSIRVYLTHPVLLFGIVLNQAASSATAVRFPRFSEIPAKLHGFSYANREFAPPRFRLEENGTPWLL
jgi:hypothetical protein